MTTEFTELVDLAAERLGGESLLASDEFFAPKENLLKSGAAVFIEGKYTDNGKWMDGWETRRRRPPGPGPDWCIIGLGSPGSLLGFDVDTAHFKGNFPQSCSIEAIEADQPADPAALARRGDWREVVPRTDLKGDAHNLIAVAEKHRHARSTHLRLNIFPDGGVARLRAYGLVMPDWKALRASEAVDLAAVRNGGMVLSCSDMFFGPRHNLIMPGRSACMSDGWETRRRRGPGHDWCVVRLGRRGTIARIDVDTSHFKGNYPDACTIEGCDAPGLNAGQAPEAGAEWFEILARSRLGPHAQHFFEADAVRQRACTHVRLNIFPDGGVARLRLYGSVEER